MSVTSGYTKEMLVLLGLLALLLVATHANPVFLPREDLYPSLNHWAIHLPLNITHLSMLDEGWHKSKNAIDKSITQSLDRLKVHDSTVVRALELAEDRIMAILNKQGRDTKMMLDRIHKVERKKRNAFLNFFNFASKADIEELSERADTMFASTEEMMHVVSESTTFVKQLSGEIKDNYNSLEKIDYKISLFQNEVNKAIEVTSNIIVPSQKLHIEMNDIFRALMLSHENLRQKLSQLEIELALAQGGIVPRSLVTPDQLQKILANIKKNLPGYVDLPFHPHEVDKFYPICTPVIHKVKMGYLISIYVPLMSTSNLFNVFQIFNFPLPKKINQTIYKAKYDLEGTKYLAISTDRTHFVPLKDYRVELSFQTSLPFFSLDQAVQMSSESKSCILSLFNRNMDEVAEYCDKIVIYQEKLNSDATYLGNGHWAIVQNEEDTLTTECFKRSPIETDIKQDIVHITLEIGCRAHTEKLSLPTYFYAETNVDSTHFSTSINRSMEFHIWDEVFQQTGENEDTFDSAMGEIGKSPEQGLSVRELSRQLKLKNLAKSSDSKVLFATVVLPVILAFVFAVAVIIIYKYRLPIDGSDERSEVDKEETVMSEMRRY